MPKTFEDYLKAGRVLGEADRKMVEAEVATMYRDAYKEATASLERFLAKGYDPEDAMRYNRLGNLLRGIEDEYKKLTGKAMDTTLKSAADSYIESYKKYEWALNNSGVQTPKWGMPPVDAVRASVMSKRTGQTFVQRFGVNAVGELSKIQGTLTRGIIQGKGYAKIALELKGDFNRGYNNALRVVRTESARNWTEGFLQAHDKAEGLGIEVKKMWVATLDDRTRDSHGMLDGEYADADGLFWINGESAEGPGLFDDPAESINCRCAVIDVLVDAPPALRRERDVGVTEYQDWVTWATGKGWSPETGWPKLEDV